MLKLLPVSVWQWIEGVPWTTSRGGVKRDRKCSSIYFEIPETGAVAFAVHDVQGRRVRQLLRGERLVAGQHVHAWDDKDDAGRPLASGLQGMFSEQKTPTCAAYRRRVGKRMLSWSY